MNFFIKSVSKQKDMACLALRLLNKMRSPCFESRTCIVTTSFNTKISAKQKNLFQFRKRGRNSNMEECQVWDPLKIFYSSADQSHAVVILNRPIRCDENFMKNIWKTAQVTVTVDGGTDRWLTFIGNDGDKVLNGNCTEYLPTLVTGDMDSISAEALKRLESVGSKVIHTMDQDKTDYTKSLEELSLYCKERDIKLKTVYVIAETSGRLDQIIAGISTLYKSPKFFDNVSVIQISKHSLTWLLQPGMHKIMVPEALKNGKSWCGLLPIGYPVKSVSTTGLKWNLDKDCLEMIGLVSSSNTYSNEPYVTVSTDAALVWTMCIDSIIKNFQR